MNECIDIIKKLKWHSTWRLVGLAIITLGIYYLAHYISRQTKIINEDAEPTEKIKIPTKLIIAIFILSYAGAFITLLSFFFDEGHVIQNIDKIFTLIWVLIITLWGFYAKGFMNVYLNASKGSTFYFSGLWTFLFTLYYFNFKINKLNKNFLTSQSSGLEPPAF